MAKRHKILNDPVYGFISIPYGILFDLLEHPYFQRLRRIKQVGLTHYVYPGALHTRLHHALGALHLTMQAIDVLRDKDIAINEEEAEATCIGILLHDIGHGPFSHALEHTLINIPHEQLSVLFMKKLNRIFEKRLDLALDIFEDRYPKHFLHQLISSQLDMDRMDYLNRDSFYTGVSEGVIGYDRIIKMLTVADGEIVVEQKGIYSIEKFLIARRLMYWQVYLHKTALAAEQMLIRCLQRARELAKRGAVLEVSASLRFFLYEEVPTTALLEDTDLLLWHFSRLDDVDVLAALKQFAEHDDKLLAFLARSILNRRLFRVELQNEPFSHQYIEEIRRLVAEHFGLNLEESHYLLLHGTETNTAYSTSREEIKILMKDGRVLPLSKISEPGIQSKRIVKHYLCYPKAIGSASPL